MRPLLPPGGVYITDGASRRPAIAARGATGSRLTVCRPDAAGPESATAKTMKKEPDAGPASAVLHAQWHEAQQPGACSTPGGYRDSSAAVLDPVLDRASPGPQTAPRRRTGQQ